jgi:hypothetical protein
MQMVTGEVKNRDMGFADTGSVSMARPNSIKKRKDQMTKKLVLLAFFAALALNAGAQTSITVGKTAPKVGATAPKVGRNASKTLNSTVNAADLTQKIGAHAPLPISGRGGRK